MTTSNVSYLQTKTQKNQRKIEETYPGMKSAFDRRCATCNKPLRRFERHNERHNIIPLQPHEAEAETMKNLLLV